MNKTAIGLVACLAIAILVSACQQDRYNSFNGNGDVDDSTAPIAIVNNDTVTLKEYNRALNNHGWHRQENLDTMNFKKEVLHNHLVYRSARIKAEDYPLEMTEEIQERLDDHLNGILRKMLFEKNVETRVEVTDEEVQEYYNSNQGRFYRPVEAEVAHIYFDFERTEIPNSGDMDSTALEKLRDSLTLERANEVYARLSGGQSFEKMARAFSDDKASAEKGGYFRKLNQGQLEPSLDTVIFSSIEVGKVSEPIKTEYGYHIIKVLERSGDDYAPLDNDLKEFLRNELLSTKTRAEAARYFDSLVAVSDIQYNMDFIEGNIEMSDPDWIMVMHEDDTIYYPEYEKWRDRELRKDPRIQETMIFKREIIGQIASTWMLILEARKHGYHESEEYLQAKEDFLYQEKLNKLMTQRQAKDYEPTDSQIVAYYEAHKDDFAEDRMISIQQVILEDQTTAEEVKAKLDTGANFYETALEYYPAEEEEIKKMAINLGWISKDDISPDFFNKIYKLETGEISEPIKTEWGYHIVKVLGKKGVKPLKTVRVEIRKNLMQQHKDSIEEKWSERMLEGVEIRVDKDLFNEFIFHKEWLPKPDFSKMFPRY
jgi:parvulin-like peptidyl-prolyl isomerase